MIILGILLLLLLSLSLAFYTSDLFLMYAAGVSVLVCCLVFLKELQIVKELLEDEMAQEARGPRNWLTTLGAYIGELFGVLLYRQDNLEWEIGTTSPTTDISFDDFSHLLSGGEHDSFNHEVLKVILDKFRCKACAIIFDEAPLEVNLLGNEDLRFKNALGIFFKEYFISGATDKLGLRNSAIDEPCLGDPSGFGFDFSLSASFIDSSLDKDRKAVIWLGYDKPPLGIERVWLSDLSNKLEGELAAFRRMDVLSSKVRDVETESAEKSKFISHMSHDIRSPLSNIKSVLHVLRLEGLNTNNEKFLEAALSNCDSASEIVEDLLDYTRHQAGALNSKFEEIDLLGLLDRVVTDYQHTAQFKNLNLTFDSTEKRLIVSADRGQLKRVFANLIGNAVKYTDAGEIVVSAKDLEGSVEINIADTGIGMSEEQLSQLFTPFTRFTTKAEGVGLGLVLSKILLEKNLGTITADSVLDQGTRFIVTMPLLRVGENDEESQQSSVVNRKIVFADDNKDLVASMKRGFESVGWEVLTAYDADEVIELAKTHHLDAIITDNEMPQGGAQQVLESQEHFKSIPLLVVVTGNSSSALCEKLTTLGADEVLLKPVTSAEVIDVMSVRLNLDKAA